MGFKIIVDDPQTYFSSAHFISGHEKCSRIHGHNFMVRVEIESSELDDKNFVMDFIELKKIIKEVTGPLDHKLLVPTEGKDIEINRDGSSVEILLPEKRYVIPESDIEFLKLPAITSELLAIYVFSGLTDLLKKRKMDISLRVRISESSASSAEVGW